MSKINKIFGIDKVGQNYSKKISLCYGHFSAIHPGHIRYLEYAKKLDSILCVAIKGDLGSKNELNPYQFSEQERCKGVASLDIVDMVVSLGNSNLHDLVAKLEPHYLVLGKEFEDERSSEIKDAVTIAESMGCLIQYHSGETHYSSPNLFLSDATSLNRGQEEKFRNSCAKQGFTLEELKSSVDLFSKSALLVVGDTILDQYVACDALGMSAEAPVIVVRELQSKEYIGGAAIVAGHIGSLGATCHFLSVVGEDKNSLIVSKQLKKLGVKAHLIEDDSRPTTYKTRYVVDNQKVFRVSRLKDHSLSKAVEASLIKLIEEIAPTVGGILVSDFVYGVITKSVLECLTVVSNKYQIPIYGDLQCSSQIGDVSKFRMYDLISPTEKEARISIGNKDAGIEWIANDLINKTKSKNLIMKLGADGFIAYESGLNGSINRQHFPALTTNPVDVSGAGDSLLSTVAVAMSAGVSFMHAAALGACAAGVAVQTMGNIPINRDKLLAFLRNMDK
jgi:rfaE bifunctional protein kinase chain/domain